MVHCRQLVELVTDYVEGSIDKDLCHDADEPLADCRHCRLYLLQMETVVRLLRRVAEEELERLPD